jgi:DNA-binding NtrC family response regulator
MPATTIIRVGDRPVAVELRGFEASVLTGPDTGKSARGTRRSFVVGTHSGCDLVLTDPEVSRRHVRIDHDDSGYVLTDLGSTNGTRVAGARVREAILEDGALVTLGGTTLRFGFIDANLRIDLASDEEMAGMGDHVIGRSLPMRELFAQMARVAPTDAAVLITGETGTGKEQVARALHAHSRRSAKPFVVFDCAAVPPTLIESELFGHEKGAFTGASERRAGVFERADGGTVLIDELGELAPELQPKLLRVLESNEVWRLGAQKPTPIDVRVVGATHRDLEALIAEGRFREDLFYRLAVVTLRVPPLRERRDDIPLLASHFARQLSAAAAAGDPDAQPRPGGPGWDAIFDFMKGAEWPGNVRELRNVVERAVIMSDPRLLVGDSLDAMAELRKHAEPALHKRVSLRAARDQTERQYLAELLRATDGDLDRAAEIAEVHRKSFERLLRKHNLRR